MAAEVPRKILTSAVLSDESDTSMSKQYNKEIKKRRRQAYLKRKRAASGKK